MDIIPRSISFMLVFIAVVMLFSVIAVDDIELRFWYLMTGLIADCTAFGMFLERILRRKTHEAKREDYIQDKA